MRGTVHWTLTVSMETLIAVIFVGCCGLLLPVGEGQEVWSYDRVGQEVWSYDRVGQEVWSYERGEEVWS